MKGLLDYKDISGGVRDVDMKGRVITGYLSTFGNVDNHGDIMQKGAFKMSLNERRDQIFFLNQHQFSQPHGKFAVLKEDSIGLYFESEPLVKGVSYSDDALKLYDAGIMTEHSIGFVTMQSDESVENGRDIRTIKEVKLYEGSNVTIGANSGAKFLGTKSFESLELKDVESKIKKIVKFLKNGNISDDGFMLLEIALKELQVLSFELGRKTLEDEQKSSKNDAFVDYKSLITTINDFTQKN